MSLRHSGIPQCVVIGGGQWGSNIIRTLHSLGALAGIVEADQERAAAHSQTYGIPPRSWEEVLRDPAIQGILIATPSATHVPLAQEALAHNKHVFIEKPITRTVQEARTLLDTARARGLFIMPGHLLRFHPAFCALEEFVQKGTLGDIKIIRAMRSNFGKFFAHEGILWDFGPHDLSMILALLPQELLRKPPHVQASSHLKRFGQADHVRAELRWPSVTVEMLLSRVSPLKEQRLTVLGTRGMAYFDDTEPAAHKVGYCTFDKAQDLGQTLDLNRSDTTYLTFSETSPLTAEMQAFLSGVTAPQNLSAFENAIDVQKMLELIDPLISGDCS